MEIRHEILQNIYLKNYQNIVPKFKIWKADTERPNRPMPAAISKLLYCFNKIC